MATKEDVVAVIKKLIALILFLKKEEELPTPPPAPPEMMQQMVRRKCKEHGLNLKQSNELYNTVKCESGFNPKAKFENRKDGKVWSTDWGICQINDYWWIGKGKRFPSIEYVLENPGACIDWMCEQFKAGNEYYWVCWQKQFGTIILGGTGVNRYISSQTS